MGFNSGLKGLKQFSCTSVGDKTLIISRCTVRLWKQNIILCFTNLRLFLPLAKQPASKMTASVQRCPSSETNNSSSAIQHIRHLLCNQKIPYRVYIIPLLEPAVNQKNPLRIVGFYFCSLHFNIIHPFMPRSSVSLDIFMFTD